MLTKIDKIIFAIIAIVFIGGGILWYNDYKDAVKTNEKVKQEYIEHQKETKEILDQNNVNTQPLFKLSLTWNLIVGMILMIILEVFTIRLP